MDKKLLKRLIALVLTGGVLLSSTGVYTALAASEEYTTSEYTSALVGSEETTTEQENTTTAPSTTQSDSTTTTETESTTENVTEKVTESTTVEVEKPATTVAPETTTKPSVIVEDIEDISNNKAISWVGTVAGSTEKAGSEANPYAVSSVEHLLAMNVFINDTGNDDKYFKLINNIDFKCGAIDSSDATQKSLYNSGILVVNPSNSNEYILNPDLFRNSSGYGMTGSLISVDPAVSSNSNVFFHLDGGGKSISNIKVEIDNLVSLSIFGYVNSASTITNLVVSKTTIISKYSDSQAAGIVLKNEGLIDECSFTEILIDTTKSATKAESFFAEDTTLRTYSGTAIVVDNSGTIDNATQYDQADNLVFTENVKVLTSRPYAGSVVAQNRGKINKVRARNITVHGSVTNSDFVGGLVGTNATQRTSSATGMYYCEIQKHANAGGVKGADKIGYLVGHNTGRVQRATVEGRYKTNQQASEAISQTLQSNFDVLVTGASVAGGIVGDNLGDVQLCTVKNVGVYFADATDGAIYGGIAGKTVYSIRKCIATGSTAGAGTAHEVTRYIGGIVGFGDTGSNFGVEDCYALVKIIDSKAVLGAIVGFNGDTAYKNNKIKNVYYSAIISSRPSPVSYGGAGEAEGDLTFTRPYTLASYNHLIIDGFDYGVSKKPVTVSTDSFGFSGWDEAEISTEGSVFSGSKDTSYYKVSGLGEDTLTYELVTNAKNDKTIFYYNVDITIPKAVGAGDSATILEDEPMELGILNSLSVKNNYTSDGFIGTKDNPIKLTYSDINFFYYAPAAHFEVVDTYLPISSNEHTVPAATFWGTLKGDSAGNTVISYEADRDLFRGIYGSRDDSLQNNTIETHKSSPADSADKDTNLTNGVIKNVTVKINSNSTGNNIGDRLISSVFGNICNATVKNTNITFYNAVTVVPTEGDTGLFAKAIYGNTYMYGCYVDSEYYNGNATSNIEANYDGIAGFVGVIDAEKAIIDNCGADVIVKANKSNMKNIAVFAGQIKSLKGGYIQNCYSAGGLVKLPGSFDISSCHLFVGNIKSGSSETHIYNCYYSPAHAYSGDGKYDLTSGIKVGAFTGSCKAWSFQVQNTATQLWGDASLQILAESQIVHLESIDKIDRFDLASYSNAATDLNNYFTAKSSDTSKLNTTNFRWYGRIGLSTTFTGGKNVSATLTVKHNTTGLVARLTAVSSSDLETDGDGFYLIKTPADLHYLSVHQTKLAPGTTEHLFLRTEAKLRLAADIDMSGYTIDPIGNSSTYFQGTFDGAGYTISNLNFGSGNLDHALFGYVQGATVMNLNIDSASISGNSYSAAIIGTVYDYALVQNCKVSNSVISGQNHVGGIIGGINTRNGAQATKIENCTVEKTTITSTKESGEHAYIGGIIGGTSMNATEACYAEIAGCTVSDCTISASAYGVGGIVGYAPNTNNTIGSIFDENGNIAKRTTVSGTTIKCTGANGTVRASLGGIAALFGGSSVSDCVVTGVTVEGECASGVVGKLINEEGAASTISGCTVTDSEITAPDIAGGILAQINGFAGDKTITNCKISAGTKVKALVSGGIIGNIQDFRNKKLTVSNCTNLGTIETTGKKGSVSDAAGGIVGRFSFGLQTSGILITGCLSQGVLKGNSCLGGIIGMNNGNAHDGAVKLIKDCYVTTKFESSNLAVTKGLAIGSVGYSIKNNVSNFAENVVYSSLDTKASLFGNVDAAYQSGGFDMNKGANQELGGITVDLTTAVKANVASRFYPYYMHAIVGYKDGMLGATNVIELKTNFYSGNDTYPGFGTRLTDENNNPYVYKGTSYAMPMNAAALGATTVPRFSVGNLPELTGTDGKKFAVPSTNVFSTTASESKIKVGSSSTYNKLTDVNIQTFDKKCQAVVKTTYTGIINGETVTFDVGFTVIVRGEHAYDTEYPITDKTPAGSPINPFLIRNAEDLLSIKQHHDNPSDKDEFKTIIAENPEFYYEACYKITNDITDMAAELAGKSFAPIGTEEAPFKGQISTSRNQQMKITDLVIDISENHTNDGYAYDGYYAVKDEQGNGTAVYSDALGLFGYTDGAKISNLELVDVQVNSVPSTSNGFTGIKSGALVGCAKNTEIENVKISGASNVIIEGSFGGRAGAIGGVVGQAGNNVILKDVSVVGSDNENRITVKGQYQVGGILGSSSDTTGCAITNASVENVIVNNVSTSGVSLAGGIAGQYAGIISGTDEVTEETEDENGNPVTEIVTPEKRVKVNNVTVTGMVVGGVVGSGNIMSLEADGCDLTIEDTDVTNTVAEVSEAVRNDPIAMPNGIAGGILGQSKECYYYYITGCTVDGNTTVTSGHCAGGIVGSVSNQDTKSCLIISDCTTLAKVNQLKAPKSGANIKPSKSEMGKIGAGAVIGVVTSNARVMNELTKAAQIQVKNVTAGGEVSGTFNVGGIVGSFATYQFKLNELTESLIYDCIVSAKITPLEGATDSIGIIFGEIVGNQVDPYNPDDQSQKIKVSAPFPEQDSNKNTVEYSVRVVDKVFYSSYTAGDYNLYGRSVVNDYQGPSSENTEMITAGVALGVNNFEYDTDGDGIIDKTVYSTIYDVNHVNYELPIEGSAGDTLKIPVSIVMPASDVGGLAATYQYFGIDDYTFSDEFTNNVLIPNSGSGTPFGFTISGKKFVLKGDVNENGAIDEGDSIIADGGIASSSNIFNAIDNPDSFDDSPFKITVNENGTAHLVFTYTNGLQIAIPVICGVNYETNDDGQIEVANADIFYHIVKVLPSYSYIQTADIDLSDKTKYPAKTTAQIIANFTGTYDGGNHTIKGFDITIDGAESPVGIFSKVSGVKYKVDKDGNQILDENGEPIIVPNIQNLTFAGCTVSSGNTSVGTGIAIGELANGASVSNIKVTDFDGEEPKPSSVTTKSGNVGGAIGIVSGASKIDGVTVEDTTVSTEIGSAGGAIGVILEDSAVLNSPVVKNTTVTVGKVDAQGNYEGSDSYEDIAGGIVAQARGTITGPAAVFDEETEKEVYPNAVENVKVRALIAGGAVGAVYKTNQAEAESVTHNLTLKDIRVSAVEVAAKSKDGTRQSSAAGILGFARAKANIEINNCYVTDKTKISSSVASTGGTSYSAGAVAQVDNNVLSLNLIDTEAYAEVLAQEADKDCVVHAASLVARIDNTPEILSFDGCVAGGKITGIAMKTFVAGVIGSFTDAFASNEITHEFFKNGVISAELECIKGTSANVTLEPIHRKGKFIAGYADGMFKEEYIDTLFSNNFHSSYPANLLFFATETGEKGLLDSCIEERHFKDINKDNLKIDVEVGGQRTGWNSVAIITDDGTPSKLYAKFSDELAEIKYGSQYNDEDNCKKSGVSDGIAFMGVKDADGNLIFTGPDNVSSPEFNPDTGDTEISFEVSANAPAAETLIAEYTCGLKTTADIISVEIQGSGTETDPYLIENPTQLRVVAYLASGTKYFRQIKDIDLAGSYKDNSSENEETIHYNGGSYYAPIGTEVAPFNGVYDGQGYKITNVKSVRETESNVGLFGYVKQKGTFVPTIKNVHVELMAPGATANGILGGNNVGGIAGYAENAVIENCSVAVGSVTGKQNVGGIVGNFTSSKIINCFTQSDVNAFANEGNPYAGGIVGYVNDATNFGSKISGCFASGSIYASSADKNVDRSYAAGIVSCIENSRELVIDSCLFTGTTSSGYGIAGTNGLMDVNFNISNCIDAGQNVAMEYEGFKKIPTAIASQGTRDHCEKNVYYDNALLRVDTENHPDSDTVVDGNTVVRIKGQPTSELIKTNVMADVKDENGNALWQKIENHYPVPVTSKVTVFEYKRDSSGKLELETVEVNTGTEVIEKQVPIVINPEQQPVTDNYSDAYAKFLSAPVQISEAEEEKDIGKVAYGQGLVYPVTLMSYIGGEEVSYSSSAFDVTASIVSYENTEELKDFDTSLFGESKPKLDEEGNYIRDAEGNIVYERGNKDVDLLFGDKDGVTTVYRNVFDTTRGVAVRAKFDENVTKNTYVNKGAALGGVFSNGEAYYNVQVPVITAMSEINGVVVHREIKVPLSYGTTYCIATQRQLYALGQAEYELEENAKFATYYSPNYNYKLITDIDCGDNETPFTPIGLDNPAGYTGQFDGSGHIIKNLKILQTGKDYVGMFAKLSKNWDSPYDPSIRNLTLENATVVAESTNDPINPGGSYVGTLVGYVFGSEDIVIENCHAIGYVEYEVDEEGEFILDEKDQPIIKAYHGTVTGDGSYVGGLIGKVQYPTTKVTSCSSSVKVTGSMDSVGGLIGDSGATVNSCYATGNVICENIYNTGNEERLFGVGGLIGIMSDGTVTQSFASGNVEVKAFNSGNNTFVNGILGIGGFVGLLDEVTTYDYESKKFVPFEGEAITECFSGGNVKFGTVNETSSVVPYNSTAIVGVGGFSGINREKIAHVYSSAAVNATFGEIKSRSDKSVYGVGVGGVSGVALSGIEDVYSSGSVAPSYTSIDPSLNEENCYFGVGGTVGTKMGSEAIVRYCYYDRWTNTDPDLTSIGGEDNGADARGLTTPELTSGRKPANTTFSDVWGWTQNAYPYLKTLLKEDSDNYIKTNSILSVVCVNVADDDVSAKTGAGITQALTVPREFVYYDEVKGEMTYKLDWAGATPEGNFAAPQRTRNTKEYIDIVAQVEGLEQYATRVYSRLCADMKGTFDQPYLIGSEEDLNHINMWSDAEEDNDEFDIAQENYTGFYDQWATPLGEGGEQVVGTVYYQLMSDIAVDDTVRNIPEAPESYTYTISGTDDEGNPTEKTVPLAYKGFVLKGNGYSIKNVATSGYYIKIVDEHSTISNIIFENFTFSGNTQMAIVGENNGLLQDVYVKSTIGDGESDVTVSAGLVHTNGTSDKQIVYVDIDGENPAKDEKDNPIMCGTIDGCVVDATIKRAANQVGVMAFNNKGTIKNSGTAGTLDTAEGSAVSKIGAFVVNNFGTIENSFSMADVNVNVAEGASVQYVSGFAATNDGGKLNSVYTRSAITFDNEPEDSLTIASLVGEVKNITDTEHIKNSYAAGLLGYFNPEQDSILFGTVGNMPKLTSVYVDKSLAGEKSYDSVKYSASLSSIMNLKYVDGLEYTADNPETTDVNEEKGFIAGKKEDIVLPQLGAILNAENHKVVDESGNLIYVDTETLKSEPVTYTLFTESYKDEDDNLILVRKYSCSDGEFYLADDVDNVIRDNNKNNIVDEGDDTVVTVDRLKLQYSIYLDNKVIIRNYDVLKAYSKISSMTIKTGQSQYADRLAPYSSEVYNSQVSTVDGVHFALVTNNKVVDINNASHVLSANNQAGPETIMVADRNKIKLSRGMLIQPTLYIEVGVSNLAATNLNPNFSGGKGTVDDPYVIKGAPSLTSLHYYGTESDLYFVLGDDINMDPKAPENAGRGLDDFQIHHFTAHLNDPESISNDTYQYAIQNFTSTSGHGGLFGVVEDAVINNIALTGTVESGELCTGALADEIRGTVVKDLEGNITGGTRITNCVVSANVTSNAGNKTDENGNVVGTPATGVLAGAVSGNSVVDNDGKTHHGVEISGIVTTGNVTVTNPSGAVGGVIGSAQGVPISEILSTANVAGKIVNEDKTETVIEGSAGVVGKMLVDSTLTNALYGGVSENKKPIVGTVSGAEIDEEKVFFDSQITSDVPEDTIGTGLKTEECATLSDVFVGVDEQGKEKQLFETIDGFYPLPLSISEGTIGDGGKTTHEGYGSTAALAAATMNFYLGSSVGQLGFYTSMQFINTASGSAISASEDGNSGYFSITPGTDVYTITTAKYKKGVNPGISFTLENGAVRTVYPGLVRNANISYIITNPNGYNAVEGKLLGLLVKSVPSLKNTDANKVQVLNGFTNVIGEEQNNLSALAIAEEMTGFYVGEMLPKGYEYDITAEVLDAEGNVVNTYMVNGEEVEVEFDISTVNKIYGQFITIPDVTDENGNTLTKVRLTLEIVESEKTWGVNSIVNTLWN